MKNDNRKVCLITPNHISTNPRLVKEAAALSEAGYKVHLVFTQHTDYLAQEDLKILGQHPDWTYRALNWTKSSPKGKLVRFISGLQQKLASGLNRLIKHSHLAKIILNRHYYFQLNAALKAEAELYIAHNAGALAVAADAAGKRSKRFAFDAEDFHRGQELAPEVIAAVKMIEGRYLSEAVYVTAASPLIAREYEQLFPLKVTTIQNVFPFTAENKDRVPNDRLNLLWFSQTVGANRGLQDVIKALRIAEPVQMELHIYGYLPGNVKKELDSLITDLAFSGRPPIYFHDPVSPDALLALAGKFDIGLATEPGFCKNNEIALSNKIFTYLVGGNAVIFSNTPAQAHFYSQNPGIGFLYEVQDAQTLSKHLRAYAEDRALLEMHKKSSRALFESRFNWEMEKLHFLAQVEAAFSRQRINHVHPVANALAGTIN